MCESGRERRGLFDSPASYQTVSRLQQLLSAQNTQALPLQLKGSLTKSGEGENALPGRAELPPAQGALGGHSIAPAPGQPQPQVPWQWLWDLSGSGPASGAWAGFGVQQSLQGQVMGLRAAGNSPWGGSAKRQLPQQAGVSCKAPRSCSPSQWCKGSCTPWPHHGGTWTPQAQLWAPPSCRGLQRRCSCSGAAWALREGWEVAGARSQERNPLLLSCILAPHCQPRNYLFPSQALCPLRGFCAFGVLGCG